MVQILYAGLRDFQRPEFAYIESNLSTEKGDISVPNLDCISFLHLLDICVPEGEEDDAGFVSYEEFAYLVGASVSSGNYFPQWGCGYYLCGQAYSPRPRGQVRYLDSF